MKNDSRFTPRQLNRNCSVGIYAPPHAGPTAIELRVIVGHRQARRAAMFIVAGTNTPKLSRSAMIREHFAPTGLGGSRRAMAIDIALLTELSGPCSA